MNHIQKNKKKKKKVSRIFLCFAVYFSGNQQIIFFLGFFLVFYTVAIKKTTFYSATVGDHGLQHIILTRQLSLGLSHSLNIYICVFRNYFGWPLRSFLYLYTVLVSVNQTALMVASK